MKNLLLAGQISKNTIAGGHAEIGLEKDWKKIKGIESKMN